MPEYRFYTIQKDGHINGPPKELTFPDDAAALKEAKQLLEGHAIEVWRGTYAVGRLEPGDKSRR
ncbi:MAG TPA: hypothetical protein VGC38_04170 [Pseudolabrys sp.]